MTNTFDKTTEPFKMARHKGSITAVAPKQAKKGKKGRRKSKDGGAAEQAAGGDAAADGGAAAEAAVEAAVEAAGGVEPLDVEDMISFLAASKKSGDIFRVGITPLISLGGQAPHVLRATSGPSTRAGGQTKPS